MKKIYKALGFIGFFLVIGSAGGADTADFKTTVILMLAGLAMMASAPLLVKIHTKRLRYRRFARYRNKSRISIYRIIKILIRERSSNLAEHRKSLELC